MNYEETYTFFGVNAYATHPLELGIFNSTP